MLHLFELRYSFWLYSVRSFITFSEDHVVLFFWMIYKGLWSKAIKSRLRCDQYAIVTYFQVKTLTFKNHVCLRRKPECVLYLLYMWKCIAILYSHLLVCCKTIAELKQYQCYVRINMENCVAMSLTNMGTNSEKKSLNFPNEALSFFGHKHTPCSSFCYFILFTVKFRIISPTVRVH